MNIGMEILRGLRYKLRMMVVTISGLSLIYGDNISVIHNTRLPESTLKEKSNSISYHAIRASVTIKNILTRHLPSVDNPEDIRTKTFTVG